MPKKIGEGLKNTLQNAADGVKTAVKDAKVPEVKLPEDVQEKAKEIADKAKTLPGKAKVLLDKNREEKSQLRESESEELREIRVLSTRAALKIIYYVMSADGKVVQSEAEKYDSIGMELDPNFKEARDQIIGECLERIELAAKSENYLNEIQLNVESTIRASQQTADSYITPKLLAWDLLTIAYSDSEYQDAESSLIKYIVERLGIDQTIFLEMENSILTLMDLEKEINWLKTTDRPYLTIEMMVNEIEDRKNVIFESVKSLIIL